MTTNAFRRRVACHVFRFGAIGSGVMLVLGIAAVLDSGGDPVLAAAVNSGAVTVLSPGQFQPLTSGGSATQFVVRPPTGAACTGDSASGGYRVQSYVVPVSVDPGALDYSSAPGGPLPAGTGDAFRQPLRLPGGGAYSNITTGIASTPGGGGPVPTSAAVSFSYLGAGGAALLPAGTYNVGLACTLLSVGEKYWNVQLTIVADAADPAGIRWTVGAPVVDTTTTTTTTVDTTTTTSTTIGGATTTSTSSVPGATTSTTVAGATSSSSSTTSSSVVSSGAGTGSGTGSQAAGGTGGSPSSGSFPVSGGTLPRTGSSPTALVVWGVLLLVFGRMAILLGRKPRVV